ncbi:MAG: tetratricopeptide repeat protein [Phycisphaeraceae bacterium]
MAGRVNTKFVIILGAVLVLLTVGLATAYLKLQTSAEENADRAANSLAQGDAEAALEEMGKAVNKQPNNVRFIVQYVRIAQQTDVTDPTTAQNLVYRTILGQLEKATSLAPNDPEPFEMLMDVYMRLGREGDFNAWNRIYERAESTLTAIPDFAPARRYRGIAQVHRMQSLPQSPAQRQQALKDLQATLEVKADDTEMLHYLAVWHLAEAGILEREGVYPEKVAPLRAEALSIAQQMGQMDAQSLSSKLNRARIYVQLKESDQAAGLLNEAEAAMLKNPQPPEKVLELAELLVTSDRQRVDRGPSMAATSRGIQRAEVLLRAAADANPNSIRLAFALGRALAQQQLTDDAIKVFDRVRSIPVQGKPVDALMASQMQFSATVQYAHLLLRSADGLQDAAKRDAIFNQVQQIVTDRVIPVRGNDSMEVNLLQGELAMARQQWPLAVLKLGRASTQMNDANPEVLLQLSRASQQADQPGDAANRLKSLLDRNPNILPLRLELARIQLQMHRPEEARRNIDFVLAAEKDSRQAQLLLAAYWAQTDKLAQALEIYQRLQPSKNHELIPPYAALLVRAQRPDEARTILESLFRIDPKNLNIMQMLMRLAKDADQALAYIEQARLAGAEPRILDLLKTTYQDPGGTLEEILKQIESNPNATDFERAMQRYVLLARAGKPEEAQKHLLEAARLEPENPTVIEVQFGQALTQSDWAQARRVADHAARLNLDLAGGGFYFGRMALAQEDYARAVTEFRRGLEARPVYSEGWRQLGDAQRMLGEIAEAQNSYRRAIQDKPNNVFALRGLATVLNQLGQSQATLEILRQASDIAPQDRELMNQYLTYEERYGDAGRALALREKIRQNNPEDVDNIRAIAMALARQKHFADAEKILNELIAKEGKTLANLASMASLMTLRQDIAGAEKLLRDYIRDRGDQAASDDWILLAKFYLTLGDHDEQALAAFRNATAVEDATQRPATRELADLLFDRGLFNDALEYYQKLYEADPNDKRVAQRYIEALLRSGSVDLAARTLTELTRSQGQDATTFVLAGMVARARGDDAAALAAFKSAIGMAPTRGLLYYQYAEQLATKPGREPAAIEQLGKALEHEPQLIPARMLLARMRHRHHDLAETIRDLQLLITDQPRLVPARLMLAQVFLENNQVPQLRQLLEDSANTFPQDTRWLVMQAKQAQREKRNDEAIAKLTKAVQVTASPENVGELAMAYLDGNHAAQAMALLQKHEDLAKSNPYLLAIRGRAEAVVGRNPEAHALFARAVDSAVNYGQMNLIVQQMVKVLGVDPTLELLKPMAAGRHAVWVELVIASHLADRSQFAAAVAHLDKIDLLLTDGSPERASADRLRALALHRLNQPNKAREIYARLLAGEPDDVATLNNLAYLLVQSLNQPQQGLEMAQRAIKLAPEDPQVLDTLGWALFKAGQSAEALRTLNRSVDMTPLPANHYHLAEVLSEVGGTRQEVVRHLEAAKKLATEKNDTEILQAVEARLAVLKGN